MLNNIQTIDQPAQVIGTVTDDAVKTSYTVSVNKGKVDSRVSNQWSSRPDDQKFLDMQSLRNHVGLRTIESTSSVIDLTKVKVNHDNGLSLELDNTSKPTELNHWSFGQLCALTKTPASYLRQLPSKLAAINLQYGLMNSKEDRLAFVQENTQGKTLRAMNSESYGRIFDSEVVDAVMQLDLNRWKVPGMLDWGSNKGGLVQYNPFVNVTKDTTTLYASDRDVYIFLVDDTHPIEVGKLPNGDPDLMFKGFIVWNSEVGSKVFGMSTMMLRGVCCNRNLWGVGETNELRIKHSKNAPKRFMAEASPMLERYVSAPTLDIVSKVIEAKKLVVASNDDDRMTFGIKKAGLTKSMTDRVLEAVLNEEQHEASNVWDFVQGITAVARGIQHQDDRLALEHQAASLMDKVSA